MKTATANLFFDQRRGHNSIKILVTFDRVQRMYATGHITDGATFERLKKESAKDKPDGKIKDPYFIETWASLCNDFERSKMFANIPLGKLTIARKIVSDLGVNFDFETFKYKFDNWGKVEAKIDDTDVVLALNTKAAKMRKAERLSHASLFELAAKSLLRFVASFNNSEKKEFGFSTLKNVPLVIRFENVTTEFLNTYETWALHYGKMGQGKTPQPQPATSTTIGIYMRHLRVVFNDAKEKGIVTPEAYPFGKKRYQIPAGENTKKALCIEDIGKIMNYDCSGHELRQRAKDFWIFSYLCNGMNFVDILSLKFEDVDLKEQRIEFVRQKTARSTKGKKIKIEVKLNPLSLAIIERWGSSKSLSGRSTDYLFPFLTKTMTAEQRKATVHQFVKMTNYYMGTIAKDLGIEGDVNTYSCRHSFATILLHSEAPIPFISQSLGHANIKTTQSYLGSFGDEKTQSYRSHLMPKDMTDADY